MLKTILITVLVFVVIFALMAIGVFFGRRPIRSGCHAAAEDLHLDCAAGCQKPCFKRKLHQTLHKLINKNSDK